MSRRPLGERLKIVLSHVYSWPEVRRGGERYLHELASALADAGHTVTVLSTAAKPGKSTVLGVTVKYFRRRRVLTHRFGPHADEVAFGFQTAAWIAARRIDVWHALGTSDAAASAAIGRHRGFRSLHTTLGIPERSYRDSRPDRRLHDYVVEHVDSYICLSAAAGRALRDGWGREPSIVGGGVDLRSFMPMPSRHPRPVLLYSGTLSEERKNIPLLLEATAILRSRHPDLELWMSTADDISPFLASAPPMARKAVVPLGAGSIEDQARRYGLAWATVLPSVNEAFGLALLESLACGTPVVALRNSGGPEEFVEPEVGALASERSGQALADSCEQAFDLANKATTPDACRAVAARYDWRSAIVPRLERLYRAPGPGCAFS